MKSGTLLPGSPVGGDVDNDTGVTTLTLYSDYLTNSGGTVKVDATAELELTNGSTIDGGNITILAGGELESVSGSNTIKNLASGDFSNSGSIEVVAGTLTLFNDVLSNPGSIEVVAGKLVLDTDTLTDTGGTLQVDATGTLDLTNGSTIDGGGTGIFTNHGLTEAIGGVASTIENFSGSNFTNDGTIEVKSGTLLPGSPVGGDVDNDTGVTTLTLYSDYLTNSGGTVQVDATAELELTNGSTIDAGNITILAGGELESVSGNNTIKNLASGDFSNSGTIEVVAGTLTLFNDVLSNPGSIEVVAGKLVLDTDTLTDTGGTLQVDATGTLDLTNGSTIDGGGTGIFTNHGLTEAIGGVASTIENFSGSNFTNDGTIEVKSGTLLPGSPVGGAPQWTVIGRGLLVFVTPTLREYTPRRSQKERRCASGSRRIALTKLPCQNRFDDSCEETGLDCGAVVSGGGRCRHGSRAREARRHAKHAGHANGTA